MSTTTETKARKAAPTKHTTTAAVALHPIVEYGEILERSTDPLPGDLERGAVLAQQIGVTPAQYAKDMDAARRGAKLLADIPTDEEFAAAGAKYLAASNARQAAQAEWEKRLEQLDTAVWEANGAETTLTSRKNVAERELERLRWQFPRAFGRDPANPANLAPHRMNVEPEEHPEGYGKANRKSTY